MTAARAVGPESLRQYAFVADGERGGLVGPHGELAWLCFPRWDSPPICAGLLGGGGVYQVEPGTPYVWGGFYEDSSLIWRHRFTAGTCELECTDALALDADPTRMTVLRRLTILRGSMTVRVRLDLRTDWDRRGLRELACDADGRWTGRVGEHHVSWDGAPTAAVARAGRGSALELEVELADGRSHDLVLSLSSAGPIQAPVRPDALWAATREGWRRRMDGRAHEHLDRDAQHSRAVLSGLTTSTGGMVAAATTSLPERAHQQRDYDYRYVWLRDSCFAGIAGAAVDDPWLAGNAVRFVSERILEHGPDTCPAYTVDGRRIPPEEPVDLPGYPGGGVVVGNRVRDQWQLDVFGDALLLFAAADSSAELDQQQWDAAEICVAAIEQRWRDEDSGIWELEPRRWTHSQLICAAGLRALARRPRGEGTTARWAALADAITAEACRTGLHPTGRLQRSVDDDRVDAALILPIVRGALPVDDPRARATIDAVRAELVEDEYVYRFRHDSRPLADAEGAFLLCSFALSLAELERGDLVAATTLFERGRTSCGTPALFTEEYDIVQRQLRGNLPQAFVHALMLETSHTLSRARRA